MNFQFAFEPGNGLCVYRLSDEVTVGGLLKGFAAARGHPGWSDDYDFLTLLDRVSLGDMSPGAMDRLMALMRAGDTARPAQRRRGAIVCNDPLSQALLIYWEHTASDRLMTEERVFRFENEAREWLRSERAMDAADKRSTG